MYRPALGAKTDKSKTNKTNKTNGGSGGLGSARHELVEQLLEALIGQRLAAPSAAAAGEIDALLVELLLLLELELVTLGGLSLLLL
jgi:hypothetical protein